MKRSFLFVLGICLVLNTNCYAAVGNATVPGEIGRFVAQRGADGQNGTNGINGTNGADCNPTETRTRCGPTLDTKCYENGSLSQKTGVKIERSSCPAGGSPIVSYLFDNECGVTVDSVSDVHQDDDVAKPVTHKRVTFKNTCTDTPLGQTADIPVGEDGSNCEAEVVVTACGPLETEQCDVATKQGIKIQKKNCAGTILAASTQYIYNGDAGAACNSTITTERCGPTLTTKCYENGSLSQKTGVKITKTNCSGSSPVDAYTYDGDVGTGIYYQGELNDCSALTTLKNNTSVTKEPGYAWFVKNLGTGYDAGKLYIWTNNTFPDCPSGGVPFQGPQGVQGEGVCDGVADAAVAIKNTVRSYEAPTSGARGYMKLHHTKCNDSTEDDQIKDECVPIIAASSATCSSGTYLECKPQGTYAGNSNYTKYNVCETTTGTTIASALSGKEDDPCTSDPNSMTVVKKENTTVAYSKGSTVSGKTYYSQIGSRTVTRETCNSAGNSTFAVKDNCVEIGKPSGECTAATSAYLRCIDQTDGSTYYVCQDLGVGNNSLANKIDGKMDVGASIADTQLSNKVITTDNLATNNVVTTSGGKINAGILPDTVVTTSGGKINAGVLPDTVVTTGNDATHGFDTLLGNSVSTAVSTAISTEIGNGSQGAFKDFVTNGDLTSTLGGYVTSVDLDSAVSGAVEDATFSFAGVNDLKLSEIVSMLNQAVGTCNTTDNGARVQTSCSGGALGNISLTRDKEE